MPLNLASETFIETNSKVCLDFASLKGTDFNIDDIALGLSHACRFAGQIPEFYSVAQHSVLADRLAYAITGDPDVGLAGLMHDASEAYTGDITKPLKKYLGEAFTNLEDKMMGMIASQHDIRLLCFVEVKKFDAELYDIEDEALRRGNRMAFIKLIHNLNLEHHGRYWHPRLARTLFTQEYHRFKLLVKERRGR